MIERALRLLLVEANAADADLFRKALTTAAGIGLDVTLASSVAAAREPLAAGGVDAIALALTPAGGLDQLAAMREQAAGLPIIVITAPEDEALGAAAVGLGAQDHLVKGRSDPALIERAFRYAVDLQRVTAQRQASEARRTQAEETAAALAEISRVLSQGLDPDVVARRITDHVCHLLGAQSAAMYGLDNDSGALVSLPSWKRPSDTFEWIPMLAAGTGLAGLALRLRQPLASADLSADPRLVYAPDVRAVIGRAHPYRALLAVPLFVGDRAFGVLSVGDVTGRVFTEDEIRVVRLFGDQAVLALDNARLHAETTQRQREAEVIAALAATLNASLDLDATLQAVAAAARELCGGDAAHIALRTNGPEAMVFRCCADDRGHRFEGVRVELGAGPGGRVIATGAPYRTAPHLMEPTLSDGLDGSPEDQELLAHIVVPIRGAQELEGLLYVVNSRPVAFTDRDEAVLVRLADHAAIAIRNAQSFARERRARAAAEALADLGRLVSQSVNPEILAGRIAGSLRGLLEASNAALYRLDEASGELRLLGVSDDAQTTFMWLPILARGRGAAGLAARKRCTVAAADVLRDARLDFDPDVRARLAASDFRAVLAVPLVVHGRVIGVLGVGDRVGRVFEPDRVRLAEAFADQAALALENARLFAETQERRREAEVIADLARTFNASLDLATTLQAVAVAARELCGSDTARVALLDPGTDAMVVRYGDGPRAHIFAGLRMERGQGIGGLVMITGKPFRTDNYLEDTRFSHDFDAMTDAVGSRAFVMVPIHGKTEMEGLLVVANNRPVPFTERDEAILVRLADHAAIAIRNAQSFAREHAALADAQTTAEALRESEEKMRVIVDTALDAVVIMDAAGTITGWNAQAEIVFGWTRAEVLGRALSETILPGGSPSAHEVGLRRFVRTGDGAGLNRRIETVAVCRDGREIPVELTISPARTGASVSFSAFIRDITDRRRAEQRQAVQFAVTRTLAEAPTLSDAIPRLLRTLCEGLGWTLGEMWRIDGEADLLRWDGGWHPATVALESFEADSRVLTFERGAGVVGCAWESGEPVWAEDVLVHPRFLRPERARAHGLRAVVAVPIMSGLHMTGVMTLYAAEPRPADAEMMRILADVGGQSGQFAERRRAEEEVAVRARQQAVVAEVSRFALTGAELSELMDRAVRLLARTLDVECCRILELSAAGDSLLLRAATGVPEEAIGHATVSGEGTQGGLALTSGKPVFVEDFRTEQRFQPSQLLRDLGIVSGMTVPIQGQARPFGVLAAHTLKRRRFTGDDAHFLQTVGSVIAAAFERRQADAVIRESERRYRLLADNITDIIWVRDLDLATTYVSPSTLRLLGFTVEEAMAQRLDQTLTPESHQAMLDVFTTAMREGLVPSADPHRSLTVDLENRCKDGSTIWMETTLTFLHDGGGAPMGILSVSRDISARRRAEDALRLSEEQFRQAQKMEAIGRLAGGVAHDFNNILTVIDGRSQLMLAKLPAQEVMRRDLEIVREAARRATGLTRQLLAFSRKQVLQPRVLDLNAAVASMTSMLRHLIGEDVELVTVPGVGLARVQADPGQLEQVIMNLAINARDAMPGGGRLTITTLDVELPEPGPTDAPGARAGRHVMLSVTDTGTGMDEVTRARVFEPFFTTKEPGKGTGLGLSTVYGIVTQSGGRVAVSSEAGAGTTFSMSLPAVDAAAQPSGALTAESAAHRATETILLVEDEENVRELAEEMLVGMGYVVLSAANGPAALAVCARTTQHIDLMLTDVIMPQMSGKEAADRARRLRPGLKVLYMSGYTDDAIGHHGVLDPGATLLEKPFTQETLARKLREVLESSS